MEESCERPALGRWAARKVADLTLEQKIGQMVVFGFPGTECSREVTQMIRDCHIGGVMLTEKNIVSPVQTRSLIDGLQRIASEDSGLDLFVAVDQEGGNVSRFCHPATVLPTAMAIAATGTVESVKSCAKLSAVEMRSMGINVNFAPVLDVNSDHANPVIGVRSYGDSPELVSKFGTAAIETFRDNGIIATAKHFPGHGSTAVDSHLSLPTICRELQELFSTDLPPFEAAIRHGVDMVMTAHAIFPQLTDSDCPATVSHDILSGLLRQRMGFEGLVITDALVMDAIADQYSLEEASIAAVEAGADVVLMLSSLERQRRACKELVAAVKAGRLSEERIDESVCRILLTKRRQSDFQPNGGTELADWPVREHQRIVRDVARKSITLIRNRDHLLPIGQPDGRRLGIIEFAQHRFSPVEDSRRQNASLATLVAKRRPDVRALVMDAVPSNGLASAERVVEQSDLLVIATRNAHLVETQASLVRQLTRAGKPTAIVALRNPYDLVAFPDVGCYAATYGDSPCLVEAACDLLFGDYAPSGRLPVTLPGRYARGYGQQSF